MIVTLELEAEILQTLYGTILGLKMAWFGTGTDPTLLLQHIPQPRGVYCLDAVDERCIIGPYFKLKVILVIRKTIR